MIFPFWGEVAVRYALLILTAMLVGCASASSRDAMSDLTKQRQEQDQRLKDAGERMDKQRTAINASFVPLVACVKRQAFMLAAEPEPADTLSRVALSRCGQQRSDWKKVVRQARDIFDSEKATAFISSGEGILRDGALQIIVDQRARARQAPQPAPSIRNDAI